MVAFDSSAVVRWSSRLDRMHRILALSRRPADPTPRVRERQKRVRHPPPRFLPLSSRSN